MIDITDPRSRNTRAAVENGVVTVPTLQVFDPDGTAIDIHLGGMPPGDLILWLQKCRYANGPRLNADDLRSTGVSRVLEILRGQVAGEK